MVSQSLRTSDLDVPLRFSVGSEEGLICIDILGRYAVIGSFDSRGRNLVFECVETEKSGFDRTLIP